MRGEEERPPGLDVSTAERAETRREEMRRRREQQTVLRRSSGGGRERQKRWGCGAAIHAAR